MAAGRTPITLTNLISLGLLAFNLFSFQVLAEGDFVQSSSSQSIRSHQQSKAAASRSAVKDVPMIRTTDDKMKTEKAAVLIVFSDIDGTLVHYPKDPDGLRQEPGNRILKLPPSSTGMVGVISSKTLCQCREIRRQGVKLVLISGMRTSTLLKRLPYLPKADAYCSEAGRIFYPSAQGFQVTPEPFDGADEADLSPFCIAEDMEWRKQMEKADAAGKDGYVGNEVTSSQQQQSSNRPEPVPVSNRKGALWLYALELMEKGFVLDVQGYACCFRVNRKHQMSSSSSNFDALLERKIPYPPELAQSTNLGCIDFYPVACGKKNCCLYLGEKFGGSSDVLPNKCLCLCDDDNDLEMALACLHAYIPSVSSTSLAETLRINPSHFTQTESRGQGTIATEEALFLALERIKND